MKSTIVFDTETSGLTKSDSIIEIAMMRLDGMVAIDCLVKPVKVISPMARNCHGISTKMAQEQGEDWEDVWAYIRRDIIPEYNLVAYNSKFDIRMILQTNKHHGIEDPEMEEMLKEKTTCAMAEYKEFAENRKNIKLCEAVDAQNIVWNSDWSQHRAMGDVQATVALLNKIRNNP